MSENDPCRDAYDDFLRRRQQGEGIRFEEFCAERPDLADGLRALHALREGRQERSTDSRETHPVGPPDKPGEVAVGADKLATQDVADARFPGEGQGSHPRFVSRFMNSLDPDARPEHIGPYRILRVLGEGGMGVVYLAEQTEPIKRRVALKLIKLGMDTKHVVARFEAERQALAMMNHPNIARVHDAGATADGRPYFVMEHVAGIPLNEYCDGHKLSLAERLELFLQVCHGVQHAHHKGIIHRDLKPSNILVASLDDKPLAKIIDFGVAKATDHRLTEKTLYTDYGMAIGTPAYMSPEQAELGAEDVDTRTDIYSLGAILYELLVGVLPFDDKALRKAGIEEMRRIIREEDPPTPSLRLKGLAEDTAEIARRRRTETAFSLTRAVRGDLDWITMKALEKDRTRRYATASELASDIQRHLNHEPVQAGPAGGLYRLRKLVSKHRGAFVGAAAVWSALLAGIVVSTILFFQMREARDVADEKVKETQIALEEKDRALGEKAAALTAKDGALAAKEAAIKEKDEAFKRSEGLRFAAESSLALSRDPGLALLLALRSHERYPGGIANDTMTSALHDLREVKTLLGHRGAVNEVCYSPDGELIASASDDKTVRVWSTRTGEQVYRLGGHGDAVLDARFSPDGKYLLSITGGTIGSSVLGGDIRTYSSVPGPTAGHAKVWLAATGALLFETADLSSPYAVDFSPDGIVMAFGLADGAIQILRAADGHRVAMLAGHGNIGLPQRSRQTRQRQKDSGQELDDTETPGSPPVERQVSIGVLHLSFNHDGTRLVTSPYRLGQIASSPSERNKAASGTASGDSFRPRVWDTQSGAELPAVDERNCDDARFESGSDRILAVGFDRNARVPRSNPALYVYAEGSRKLLFSSEEALGLLRKSFEPPEGTTRALFSRYLWPEVNDRGGFVGMILPGKGYVWITSEGKLISTFDTKKGKVLDHALSADGSMIAGAFADHTAAVWASESGDLLFTLRGHTAPVKSCTFSPAGHALATGGTDGTVRIWNLQTEADPVLSRRDKYAWVDFSADGSRFLTISSKPSSTGETELALWDTTSGAKVATLDTREWYTMIARQISSSVDTVKIKKRIAREIRSSVDSLDSKTRSFKDFGFPRFSPDGRLVLATDGETVRFWNSGDGSRIDAPAGSAAVLAERAYFVPGLSSSHILTTRAGNFALYALDRGRGDLTNLQERTIPVRGNYLALPPDDAAKGPKGHSVTTSTVTWKIRIVGETLAAGNDLGTGTVVFSLPDLAELAAFPPTAGTPIAFLPAGKGLLFVRGGSAVIHGLPKGEVISRLDDRDGDITSAALSDDGQRGLLGSADGTVRVWSTASGKETLVLRGHNGAVHAACFSAQGDRFATGGEDRAIHVWSARDGARLMTFALSERTPMLLGFSPDGNWLTSISDDAGARIWAMDPASLARKLAPRDFTPDERDAHLVGSEADRHEHRRLLEIKGACDGLRMLVATGNGTTWNRALESVLAKSLGELESHASGDLPPAAAAEVGRCALELEECLTYHDASNVVAPLLRIHQRAGSLRAAIVRLEAIVAMPVGSLHSRKKLDRYRDALAPEIPSFASIDAALARVASESLVATDATWQYRFGDAAWPADAEWWNATFDDTDWKHGPAPLGFGEPTIATAVGGAEAKPTTLVRRHAFLLEDPARCAGFTFSIHADDGFVAYLNGIEIARTNAGKKDHPVAGGSTADHTALEPIGQALFTIDPALFRRGQNFLAVVGLNASKESSDLLIAPALSAEKHPDPSAERSAFAAFMKLHEGRPADPLVPYLEGRILQREKRWDEAAKKFREVAALAPGRPEPTLRIAESLRNAGDDERAASELLRAALSVEAAASDTSGIWQRWFEISVLALHRSPAELLRMLSRETSSPPESDLRWVLERLTAGEPLRINCGGWKFEGPEGDEWEADRCYQGGFKFNERQTTRIAFPRPYEGDIPGTERDALYQTERWFAHNASLPRGYRIPLPPGRYEARLHFAEIVAFQGGRTRIFDVALEGRTVLEDFNPGAAGFAVPQVHAFEVDVRDAFLDIDFVHKVNNPKISAIEIRAMD